MVPERFALLLQSQNLTPASLAERVHVSEVHVRAILAGKHLPRVDKALRIARELQVRVEDLWPAEAA